MLHGACFFAICVAMALRDKLQVGCSVSQALGRLYTKHSTEIFCLFSVLKKVCIRLESVNIMFFVGKSLFLFSFIKRNKIISILFPVYFPQC